MRSQAQGTLLAQPGPRVEEHHQVQVLLWGWGGPYPLGFYKTRLFLCRGVLTPTHRGSTMYERCKGALLFTVRASSMLLAGLFGYPGDFSSGGKAGACSLVLVGGAVCKCWAGMGGLGQLHPSLCPRDVGAAVLPPS